MKSILAVLALLIASIGFNPGTASSAGAVELTYHRCQSEGLLVIEGAAGLPFWVRDSVGVMHAYGVVSGPEFSCALHGVAPGTLAVSVGGQVEMVAPSETSDWWWM